MTQSKNDSELFLCYNCNERITKSELKVEQIIIPKRESHSISYKDEYIDSAFMVTGNDLWTEPDVNIKAFNLLNQEETHNVYDELALSKEVDKIKIRDAFDGLLKDKKIKIAFAQ
jgi:hypothetical protein